MRQVILTAVIVAVLCAIIVEALPSKSSEEKDAKKAASVAPKAIAAKAATSGDSGDKAAATTNDKPVHTTPAVPTSPRASKIISNFF